MADTNPNLPPKAVDPSARGFEATTQGFDEKAPTPKTPSERAEWDRARHEQALEFHRQQNRRAGMEDAARRNQYCPKCRGVVDWKAETCPHCGAPIPAELRDYYNFSDFEPPVDRRELLPILTVLGIGLVIVGLVAWGSIALWRALF